MTLLIFFIISALILYNIYISACCKKYQAQAAERIEYNQEQEFKNKILEQEANDYKQQIDHLKWELQKTTDTFNTLQKTLEQTLAN